MGAGLVILAFLIFGLWQGSIIGLLAGIVIMDLAVQSSQVANQSRVYALDPNARSRLNTIFMATMLAGGAVGAGIGGAAYAAWGWSGTCALGAISAALALLLSWKP
jgi:predicted MFS family arabinose efflux permease